MISVIDEDDHLSIWVDGCLLAEYSDAGRLPTYEHGSWISRDEAGNVYAAWTSKEEAKTLRIIGTRIKPDHGQLQAETRLMLKATHSPESPGAVLLGRESNLFLGWIKPGQGEEARVISCWRNPIEAGSITWRPRPDHLIIP